MSSQAIKPAAIKVSEHFTGERFQRPQTLETTSGEADLSTLLNAALDCPIHHPALKESVFPGDTVAIALQRDLPQPVAVLNALLEYLFNSDIEPSDVTVVLPGALTDLFGISTDQYRANSIDDDEQPTEAPPIFPLARDFHSIACQVHDPDNEVGLSYLAANAEAEPVHMNRILVDADLVIPVGCPTGNALAEQADSLYPTFASRSAMDRYALGKRSLVDRHDEIELANDTLGAFFAIQVVAGPGDEIRKVASGVRSDAKKEARLANNAFWQLPDSTSGDAAVVTIESRPHDQSWDDFAQSLITAAQLTNDDAPLVIWSEISGAPDRNIRKACLGRFEESISSKLSRPLQHVVSILKDHPVYLRSNLPRSVVEEIGLSVIESVDEVKKLTCSSQRCIILRDGQNCRIAAS